MSETMTEELKELKNTNVLKATDRCDRCNGQAFFWVNGVQGDLLFCRHHFLKHEDSIRAYAFEIIDETHKLNERPSQSSA